jgi:hypothetical protein
VSRTEPSALKNLLDAVRTATAPNSTQRNAKYFALDDEDDDDESLDFTGKHKSTRTQMFM